MYRFQSLLALVGIGALVACSGETATTTPAGDSAATPSKAAAPAGGMTAFEDSIVGPMLKDIRAGIRPFNESGIGICKGSGKECPEYIGREVGELPEGEYMVRAELAVPNAGAKDTWKVRFETECKTIKVSKDGASKSESTNSRNKEYTVVHRQGETGYRLSPLFKIKSPHPSARQECSWKLTGLHPDGDQVYSGSWIAPQANQ